MEKITASDLIERYGAEATFVLVESSEIVSWLTAAERGTDQQLAVLRENLFIIRKQYEVAEAKIRAMEMHGMRLPVKLPGSNDGNAVAEVSGTVPKTETSDTASGNSEAERMGEDDVFYGGDGSLDCPIKLD